jgi:hypothetical protein
MIKASRLFTRSRDQTTTFWRQFPRGLASTEAPSGPPLTALEKWRAENKKKSAPTTPTPSVASNSKADSSLGKEVDEATAAAIAAKQWEESGYQEYMEDQRKKGWKT